MYNINENSKQRENPSSKYRHVIIPTPTIFQIIHFLFFPFPSFPSLSSDSSSPYQTVTTFCFFFFFFFPSFPNYLFITKPFLRSVSPFQLHCNSHLGVPPKVLGINLRLELWLYDSSLLAHNSNSFILLVNIESFGYESVL